MKIIHFLFIIAYMIASCRCRLVIGDSFHLIRPSFDSMENANVLFSSVGNGLVFVAGRNGTHSFIRSYSLIGTSHTHNREVCIEGRIAGIHTEGGLVKAVIDNEDVVLDSYDSNLTLIEDSRHSLNVSIASSYFLREVGLSFSILCVEREGKNYIIKFNNRNQLITGFARNGLAMIEQQECKSVYANLNRVLVVGRDAISSFRTYNGIPEITFGSFTLGRSVVSDVDIVKVIETLDRIIAVGMWREGVILLQYDKNGVLLRSRTTYTIPESGKFIAYDLLVGPLRAYAVGERLDDSSKSTPIIISFSILGGIPHVHYQESELSARYKSVVVTNPSHLLVIGENENGIIRDLYHDRNGF